MANPIVECIPNFSDARRPEVVDAIAAAIASVDGVNILDRHSDLDHNRTVITFVGHPEGVEQAAFLAIAKAGELIDLDQHKGEHPRIGATDVVPLCRFPGSPWWNVWKWRAGWANASVKNLKSRYICMRMLPPGQNG
jgi:glutamate formiminotransferase